ncbi:MAG: ATP-binding protein [Lachnospiraceae bacterium]|nr:ATP-binding protein [Lachnospiraceae bacterium]
MALTNPQFESIIKGYEDAQDRNRHIMITRRNHVYEQIPEYHQLDSQVSSLSIAHAKKMLFGDATSVDELKRQIAMISKQKAALLKAHNLPEDYLEPIYDCKDCKDTGYIEGSKCHCFKQQMIELLYNQSNIKVLLAQDNFSNLSYQYYEGEDLTRFQNAVKACKDFIANFGTDYTNLLFGGDVGTGKSFLSGCIAKELLDTGHSVIYFSAIDLFDTLAQHTFDSKSKVSLYNIHEDLYNCDLVIIDDLGTEMTNSFVLSSLFSLINERHLRRKPTIISTNLPFEQLRDRYSERIFSRITSLFQYYKLTGFDIRLQKNRMANRK